MTAVVVAVVTDNGAILFTDCGGAMTDGETDETLDAMPFICILLTIAVVVATSSFKLTDKRFASNVLIILLNAGCEPFVSLIRKTLCPSKQCMYWCAVTQFAHK